MMSPIRAHWQATRQQGCESDLSLMRSVRWEAHTVSTLTDEAEAVTVPDEASHHHDFGVCYSVTGPRPCGGITTK